MSCTKEWNDLLSIVSSDGLVVDNVGYKTHPVRQLEIQPSKDSYVFVSMREYGVAVMRVVNANKLNRSETLFRTRNYGLLNDDCVLLNVFVSKYDKEGIFLDLSNPKVRKAAERKFCGYVKQATAKYEKDHRQVKDDKVQKQLELLK